MNIKHLSNLIDLSYSAQYEAHLYYINIYIYIYIVYILYHLCFCIWSSNERRKKRFYKKEYWINEQKVNKKYIIYLSKIVENWYYPWLARKGEKWSFSFLFHYIYIYVRINFLFVLFLWSFYIFVCFSALGTCTYTYIHK